MATFRAVGVGWRIEVRQAFKNPCFVSSGASRKDRSHDGQGALEPERTLQRPGHHQGPGEKVDQVSML